MYAGGAGHEWGANDPQMGEFVMACPKCGNGPNAWSFGGETIHGVGYLPRQVNQGNKAALSIRRRQSRPE